MFNNHIVANCPQGVPVKNNFKIEQHLANIWEKTLVTRFYGSRCTIVKESLMLKTDLRFYNFFPDAYYMQQMLTLQNFQPITGTVDCINRSYG